MNLTPAELDLICQQIKSEAMEGVASVPETLRSEFGFGRVHGILITIQRLEVLVNEVLAKKEQAEEEFDLGPNSGTFE